MVEYTKSDHQYQVGIAGASGYTGAELLRICDGHPDFKVSWVTAQSYAGSKVASLYPTLADAYPDLVFQNIDLMAPEFPAVDLIFSALPHGESQRYIAQFSESASVVVDLAADFRLKNSAVYKQWYGSEHTAAQFLDKAVYGLPELNRGQIRKSGLIASAGCYPTAAILALAPLLKAKVVSNTGIVVDAVSGVSGAGSKATDTTHFSYINENFSAYGLLNHRHTPEIEQELEAQVIFTPHLAPMTRGILATCYSRPLKTASKKTGLKGGSAEAFLEIFEDAYKNEPFVKVVTDPLASPPSTKSCWGTNQALVGVCFDERTGWVVSLCALDNLVKGASGQAVQCANLALGLPEDSGLNMIGVYP